MATPKEISEATASTLYLNYSSFEDIRSEMQRIEEAYPELSRFYVNMETEAYREYAQVYGYRMETQEEAETREAKEAEQTAMREARERAEFERLAAKFR